MFEIGDTVKYKNNKEEFFVYSIAKSNISYFLKYKNHYTNIAVTSFSLKYSKNLLTEKL